MGEELLTVFDHKAENQKMGYKSTGVCQLKTLKPADARAKMTPAQEEPPNICRYTFTCVICILFVVTWTGNTGEKPPKATWRPVLQENGHFMGVQPLCRAWGAGPGLRSADLTYTFPGGQNVLILLKNVCIFFRVLFRSQPAKLHSCAETEIETCGLILSYT